MLSALSSLNVCLKCLTVCIYVYITLIHYQCITTVMLKLNSSNFLTLLESDSCCLDIVFHGEFLEELRNRNGHTNHLDIFTLMFLRVFFLHFEDARLLNDSDDI